MCVCVCVSECVCVCVCVCMCVTVCLSTFTQAGKTLQISEFDYLQMPLLPKVHTSIHSHNVYTDLSNSCILC